MWIPEPWLEHFTFMRNVASTNKVRELDPEKSSRSEKEAKELGSRINDKIIRFMQERGAPGLTICMSIDKKVVFQAGYGYCDVENCVPCQPDSIMRIASISKAIFSASVFGQFLEKGQVALSTSVHQHLSLSEFPKKYFNGKEHDITVEQLLTHTSGIQHYNDVGLEDYMLKPLAQATNRKVYQNDDQIKREGFYQRKTFSSVLDALDIFKHNDLKEPGKFSYTTHGFTLLSAIMQKVLQKNSENRDQQIENYWIRDLRKRWEMRDTHLDQDEIIIPRRARYYLRTGLNGQLLNAPYTDLSVKWAGGGLVSSVGDLVKFGNKLIDSYEGLPLAPLKHESVKKLWTSFKENKYGLGFQIFEKDERRLLVGHTGCSLGASSVFLMNPEKKIVIAIIVNLGFTDVRSLAMDLIDSI